MQINRALPQFDLNGKKKGTLIAIRQFGRIETISRLNGMRATLR